MRNNSLLKKVNKETVFTAMLILFLILWRIPFLNKGIDYTDTGFSMENYKNIFFSEGVHGIGRFYTMILGGFIYKLLPAYHLLVYRVLHWLLNLITYFFAYKIFEKHLDKSIILIGLIAISFGAKSGEALFSYYPLTGCLLLLSLWLMINGAKERSKVLLLISGFVSGLNIFVRLPNVLFLSMVIALFIFLMQSGEGVKKTFKITAWYIVGAAVSLIVSLCIMIMVMGIDGVVNSFMGYVRLALGQTTPGVENFLGIDEVSHHSLFANVWTVAVQVWKSVKSMVIIIPALFLGFFMDKIFTQKISANIIRVIKAIVYFVIFFITGKLLVNSIYHTLYIASILSAVIAIFVFRKEKAELVMLNSVTILMAACSVFGSDAGMTRMGIVNTMLVLVFIYDVFELTGKFADSRNAVVNNVMCLLSNLKTLVLFAVIVIGVVNLLPKTYKDADFFELNYPVNTEIETLRGMKTSRIRVEQINEYYSVMSSAELQNKEIAIFGYFPLGIVIGNQRDYFEPVQPCIDFAGVSVTKLLKTIQAKNELGIKPIIVVSYVHMQQTGAKSFTSDAKKAVLKYMLSLYEYEIYSDSENFTIYNPIN